MVCHAVDLDQCPFADVISSFNVKHAAERIMTTGNVLYLLMALGTFAVFSVTLAYQSLQQSRLGREMRLAPGGDHSSDKAVRI